jgi:hypothetical protein
MIPNPKVGQSSQDIFGNRSEWLLLDRSKISFDGTECDKVCDVHGHHAGIYRALGLLLNDNTTAACTLPSR